MREPLMLLNPTITLRIIVSERATVDSQGAIFVVVDATCFIVGERTTVDNHSAAIVIESRTSAPTIIRERAVVDSHSTIVVEARALPRAIVSERAAVDDHSTIIVEASACTGFPIGHSESVEGEVHAAVDGEYARLAVPFEGDDPTIAIDGQFLRDIQRTSEWDRSRTGEVDSVGSRRALDSPSQGCICTGRNDDGVCCLRIY